MPRLYDWPPGERTGGSSRYSRPAGLVAVTGDAVVVAIDMMGPLMKMRRLLPRDATFEEALNFASGLQAGHRGPGAVAEPGEMRYNHVSSRRGVEQAGQLVGLITRRS